MVYYADLGLESPRHPRHGCGMRSQRAGRKEDEVSHWLRHQFGGI